MATHSSILAWRIPIEKGAWRATVHGVAELDTIERLSTHNKHVVSSGKEKMKGKKTQCPVNYN